MRNVPRMVTFFFALLGTSDIVFGNGESVEALGRCDCDIPSLTSTKVGIFDSGLAEK